MFIKVGLQDVYKGWFARSSLMLVCKMFIKVGLQDVYKGWFARCL